MSVLRTLAPLADPVCFPEGTSGTHQVPILGKGQRAALASDAAPTLRQIARRRVRGRLGERNLLVYCYLRHRLFELIAWADDKPDLFVVVDLPTVYKIVKHSLRPPSKRVRTTSFSTCGSFIVIGFTKGDRATVENRRTAEI